MKIFKYLLAAVSFIVLISGCSCDGHPIQIYNIGQEYTFDTITVKVEDDVAEEKFIWYFTVKEGDEENNSFDFSFTYNTCETIRNSTEFEYSTSDPEEKIVFDENGYYRFYGSRIFYISYKNANEEIKDSIKNKEFSMSFPLGPFEYYSFE